MKYLLALIAAVTSPLWVGPAFGLLLTLGVAWLVYRAVVIAYEEFTR